MKILLVILMMAPALSFAWGEEGHRITGAIANMYLTQTTRAKLSKMVGKYSIEDLGNWLDWKRDDWDGARTFHYVSMPADATEFKTEHCANHGVCAASMIEEYTQRLLSKTESPEAKAEALKVIIHLIEDIHQPLHTGGQKDDYGGNSVKLNFFTRKSNLHKVFDTELIRHSGKSDEQYVYELTKDLTKERISEIQQGDYVSWIEDSHKHTAAIYKNIPSKKDGEIQMTEEYVTFGNKVIEEQMLEAGLRLAAFLNDVVGKVVL